MVYECLTEEMYGGEAHLIGMRLCQLCLRSKHAVRHNAVAAKEHVPMRLGQLQALVDELRAPVRAPVSPGVFGRSFHDIDTAKLERVGAEDRKRVFWLSSYDPVTRLPFAKDVSHLQNLHDALLASKNYERAEVILKGAHLLLGPGELFVLLVNKHVEALSASASLNEVEQFISRVQRQCLFEPNGRTLALLIARDVSCAARFVAKARERHILKQTLQHVALLSPDGLSAILKSAECAIPGELKAAHSDETPDKPAYFVDSSMAPTLDTGAVQLKLVDTFAMKVIRHALLGLERETLDEPELDGEEHLLHRSGPKHNYHAIYRQLPLEERARFSEALDVVNEPRQKRLELRGLDGAREKWKHEFDEMQQRGGLTLSKLLNAQLYRWYAEMLPLVKEEVAKCKAQLEDPREAWRDKARAAYAPYLVLLPPKKLCVVTILELLKLNSTGGIVDGMRAARAVIAVGRAVELEYRAQQLLKTEKRYARLPKQWRRVLSKQTDAEWDSALLAKLGLVLTSVLLHVAKVPVKGTDPSGKVVEGRQAAFFHTFQIVQGQKLGVIRLHRTLALQLGASTANLVQPQLLPMLVPPREWTLCNLGGYLYAHTSMVRVKDLAETVAYLKAALEQHTLGDVYKGLNVLGATPWTVNARILELVSRCWNTGEAFLDIPPVLEKPNLPPRLAPNADPGDKAEYQRKVRVALNEAASMRSQRCDINYKLEIARAFVGEKMYFPHSVDFRGRAYPVPPHFNHLGNDLTRLLFLFWEGRPLGKRGLEWLKIHLANLYGMDKVPLADRVRFAEEHLADVRALAREPLRHRWWAAGDKPWQVLGACMELADALALEDPEAFVSHLPVHQDGTCNGLQHYAALGGDVEGARQVNLVPSDRPQDVYAFVAGLVEKRLAEAAATDERARFLVGKIGRKVVKQTVMTNVYGVTYVGAVAQIEKQVAGLFGRDEQRQATLHARYLTGVVFGCIRELFHGAHLIQEWLGECARRISKLVRVDEAHGAKPNHLSSVIWTTPLGLPCVQPYRATKQQVVATSLQDIVISDPFGATQVDARKQQTAFPPNFVHSLDATHMLMTAAACGDAGLTFALVHDSYWTHAADVDRMNVCIRNEFVRLHQDNLVAKLRSEFERRYKGFLQVVSIPADHPAAAEIRTVRRDLAKQLGRTLTVADEVHLEKRRQELLQSLDPAQQQLGRDMTNTVSVVEQLDVAPVAVSPSSRNAFQILVPLRFPEVPQSGALDVAVVRDSPYFFL